MNLITSDYSGHRISFDESGAWFNATGAAAYFGKRVDVWLKTQETNEYIDALCRHSNSTKRCDLNSSDVIGHKVTRNHFIKTRRGNNGGTWLHPRLAIAFARWCSPDFAVWCDLQIDQILRGTHPRFDWKKARSEAASSFKIMNEAVKLVREAQGKETSWFHYANEAKLVNYALAEKSAALDRESLSDAELALLAKLEVRNGVLVAQGVDYQVRKATLRIFALEALAEPEHKIAAIA